jgi:hypothetical protein
LRKEPTIAEDVLYTAAHDNFTNVRKKYDDVRKQSVQKEETIRKLKEDIQKYQIFENEFSSKKEGGSGEVK